jgi:tetratricopeptide (TPR) repeat protein
MRIQALLLALEQDAENGQLHYELARLFSQHEDWTLALAFADSADECQPREWRTDLIRGEAMLGAGRTAEAKRALDRFLAYHPANARAHLLRARVLMKMHAGESALAEYRAATLECEDSVADHAREAAAAFVGAAQPNEAIKILRAAIERFGPEPALLADALSLEAETGAWSAALSRIAALQTGAPRPEPWMERRAELLTRAGRLVDARQAWTSLLAYIDALPNLQRGLPSVAEIHERARAALETQPVDAYPCIVPSNRP